MSLKWPISCCTGRKTLTRRSFYRAANAIFARVGRIASEEVVLHLMSTKCIPILLYGLEACPFRKTDLNSLDFVVNRFFMKLFKTGNIDLVKCCQSCFCFELPSVLHDRRATKFDIKYRNHSNILCQMISHLWILLYCTLVFNHCLCTLRLLLYICDLVKLHVAFFFSVLPFMVNKDEYV